MSSAFQKAVLVTECLVDAYRRGLQAVRKTDRQRVTCRDGRRLTGSIDVDKTLAGSHPHDHRWDYGIGVNKHEASSHQVQVVIDKLTWLRAWLAAEAPALQQLAPTFVWVASGKVALTPNSPQRRRVAQAGITFAGERAVVDAL